MHRVPDVLCAVLLVEPLRVEAVVARGGGGAREGHRPHVQTEAVEIRCYCLFGSFMLVLKFEIETSLACSSIRKSNPQVRVSHLYLRSLAFPIAVVPRHFMSLNLIQ